MGINMHRLLFLLSPVVVAFAANAASSAMFSAGRVVVSAIKDEQNRVISFSMSYRE